MCSLVHLPKSLVTGRRHRFLSGLGALRSTYKGRSTSCPVGFHRTQETLRLCGCSGLLLVEMFGEELLFSLFISLTLKGEINKVNIKQLSLFSVYHGVSVSPEQMIQLDVQPCQSLDKLVVVNRWATDRERATCN